MSREIKFRAWNLEKKIMVYEDEDDSTIYWDGVYCSDVEMVNIRLRNSEYEWMQYTGLKDKNGKKIYEGDIVKYIPLNSERLKELGMKWYEYLKVEWGAYSDDEYVMNVETWMIGIYPLSEVLLDETVEVIGNIYENPELLEGEE